MKRNYIQPATEDLLLSSVQMICSSPEIAIGGAGDPGAGRAPQRILF